MGLKYEFARNDYMINFLPPYNAAMDVRTVVAKKADLTNPNTWKHPRDGDEWNVLYNGLIVSVVDDTPENNGIYSFNNRDTLSRPESDYNINNWIKIATETYVNPCTIYLGASDNDNLVDSDELTPYTISNSSEFTIEKIILCESEGDYVYCMIPSDLCTENLWFKLSGLEADLELQSSVTINKCEYSVYRSFNKQTSKISLTIIK